MDKRQELEDALTDEALADAWETRAVSIPGVTDVDDEETAEAVAETETVDDDSDDAPNADDSAANTDGADDADDSDETKDEPEGEVETEEVAEEPVVEDSILDEDADLPEKMRGKTKAEIAQMYKELESHRAKQLEKLKSDLAAEFEAKQQQMQQQSQMSEGLQRDVAEIQQLVTLPVDEDGQVAIDPDQAIGRYARALNVAYSHNEETPELLQELYEHMQEQGLGSMVRQFQGEVTAAERAAKIESFAEQAETERAQREAAAAHTAGLHTAWSEFASDKNIRTFLGDAEIKAEMDKVWQENAELVTALTDPADIKTALQATFKAAYAEVSINRALSSQAQQQVVDNKADLSKQVEAEAQAAAATVLGEGAEGEVKGKMSAADSLAAAYMQAAEDANAM